MQLTKVHLGGLSDRIGPDCNWDLEAQRNVLKAPNLIMYYNQQITNLEGFGDESIERFSTFSNIQFDEDTPSWVPIHVHRNMLSDSTDVYNNDATKEISYNTLTVEQPRSSAWKQFPTPQDPTGIFKFSSFDIHVTQD